ncbi:NTF2 fold immunity protein [Chryseobacterium lathyri]|uniref:NTF2 fold immunity protein n=1 Tax=Chryseobacterium lathyri TaxID=395933 RepID=UPI001CBA8D6A|nr:NTF2 fold immunity protein [Chryseobacterium lathyri]
MKNYILLFILFSCCKNGVINKSEIVGSDKEIALILAERKWNEIYGKSTISKQKPFIVKQKNDSIYTVRGSYPEDVIGGVAYAEINVKTKKVIKYTHGE